MSTCPPLHQLFVVLTLALVGCAPMSESRGGNVAHSSVVELKSCGVRVAFSVAPTQMNAVVIQQELAAEFDETPQWRAEWWTTKKGNVYQGAFCACRTTPLDIDEMKRFTRYVDDAFFGRTNIREETIPGVGTGIKTFDDHPKVGRRHFQVIRIDKAPNCVAYLETNPPKLPEGGEVPFFASLTSASSSTPPSVAPGNASDRLRQLEQLRRDGLVSDDEYTNRRRVILDSL